MEGWRGRAARRTQQRGGARTRFTAEVRAEAVAPALVEGEVGVPAAVRVDPVIVEGFVMAPLNEEDQVSLAAVAVVPGAAPVDAMGMEEEAAMNTVDVPQAAQQGGGNASAEGKGGAVAVEQEDDGEGGGDGGEEEEDDDHGGDGEDGEEEEGEANDGDGKDDEEEGEAVVDGAEVGGEGDGEAPAVRVSKLSFSPPPPPPILITKGWM